MCTAGSWVPGTGVSGLNPNQALGYDSLSPPPVVVCTTPTDYVFEQDTDACMGQSGVATLTCTGVNVWSPYNVVYCSPGCPVVVHDPATVTLLPSPGCGAISTTVNVSCTNSNFVFWNTLANDTSIPTGYLGGSSYLVTCDSTSNTWTPHGTVDGFRCQGMLIHS